jgi:phage gp29-like protein
MKTEFQKKVAEFLSNWLPVSRRTIVDSRAEPGSAINSMDVDSMHRIIAQAQAGDTRDLFALYRDVILACSHLLAEFSKRKLAVIGDALSFQSAEKKDQIDLAAAEFVRLEVEDCPSFLTACSHLLDSTLYPVSVVEKVYAARSTGGYRLAELVPVPYQLLDFTKGHLEIRETDAHGNPGAQSFLPDPGRYIVHRGHLLTAPDNWGGPMRSLMFWWLLSVMDRDWWARFLDRYGSPFLVGKYDPNDDTSRSVLQRAFQWATKVGGLVVSNSTSVEVAQAAASSSAESYERFLAVCNREISKLIIGQTLSADAQPTGLGSGVAKGQEAVRGDIRQFDAMMLGRTLRHQLFRQLLEINNRPGRSPRPIWGSDSSESTDVVGKVLENLSRAGLEPSDDALPVISERLGFEIQRRPLPLPVRPEMGFDVIPFDASRLGSRAARAMAANDRIAREASAGLAQAFRGSLAPVRQIILSSRSPEECDQRIRSFYPDWSPERVSDLVGQALEAYAANGAVARVEEG